MGSSDSTGPVASNFMAVSAPSIGLDGRGTASLGSFNPLGEKRAIAVATG